MTTSPRDRHGRPLRTLRLSVTDRCDLRCAYCMPGASYAWLPRPELLTFEELLTVAQAFTELGVVDLHITGGEPLLRRDLHKLVEALHTQTSLRDLALTTNGVGLAAQAAELRNAGLRRVTVSLDTLDRQRYRTLTRRDVLDDVVRGIDAARRVGFETMKLNAVVIRGTNDDELPSLLAFARSRDVELRFIEYMDVGGATGWAHGEVVALREILERVAVAEGGVQPLAADDAGTARRFVTGRGQVFGVIASTTAPFCETCDRARLTADGKLFTCLYATHGHDLRGPLRAGVRSDELVAMIAGSWRARDDRGAERRLAILDRGPLCEEPELRAQPHLEMHTRGG